jgi:hypothetical protein
MSKPNNRAVFLFQTIDEMAKMIMLGLWAVGTLAAREWQVQEELT